MTEDGVGKTGASTRRPRGWEVRGRSGRPASALNGGGEIGQGSDTTLPQ